MSENRKRFNVRTEPLVVEIGDALELKFFPELDTQEILVPYRALVEVMGGTDWSDSAKVPPEKLEAVIPAIKNVLTSFMLPESIEVFNTSKVPDRVLSEMFMWLVEQYNEGERPTMPSSDSSPSASSSGAGSTGS